MGAGGRGPSRASVFAPGMDRPEVEAVMEASSRTGLKLKLALK